MKAAWGWRLATASTWLLAMTSAARANHTIFAYGVDRIEVDGNTAGPHDGQPDRVDDFDWTVVSESAFHWQVPFNGGKPPPPPEDGIFFLASPGRHMEGPDGRPLDISILNSSGEASLQKSAGGFDVTAYWQPVPPAPGHHFQLSMYTPAAGLTYGEIVGVGLQNLGGLAIEQHSLEMDILLGRSRNFVHRVAPVSPYLVHDRIVLRLSFQAATNTVASAVSLDGGATWRRPFPPAPFLTTYTRAIVTLSADPAGAPPTTTSTSTTTSTTISPDPCQHACATNGTALGSLGLGNGADDRRDWLTWKWRPEGRLPTNDLGQPEPGYELCLLGPDGTTLLRASLQADARCDEAPCWELPRPGVQRYYDRHRTHGGITRLVIDARRPDRASVSVRGRGRSLRMPAMPLALPVTIQLRTVAGGCWSGSVTPRTIRANTATAIRARTGSLP